MRRIHTASIGLGLVLALAVSGCGPQEEQRRRGRDGRPASVIVENVEFLREQTRVEALGTARARANATIYPESAGRVTEVLFKAGDFVETDAPLLRLEDREEQLAVRQAEVTVKAAEQLLARYRRIEDTGGVSASQIDEAETALEAAKIDLDSARVTLSERTVVAPFAGHVGLTDVDPGDRITGTTVITQLDDRSQLFVDFEAPEEVFPYITVGQPVEATPFAKSDETVNAKIIAIDSRIDPTRRTVGMRIEIDNTADAFRPGMSFRMAVNIEGERYPAVPEAAIVWGNDGAYLWLVQDGKAVRVGVTIVSRRRGLVLVRADIPEGSIVVAEGVQKVREGTPVRQLDDSTTPRPPVTVRNKPVQATQ